MSNLSRSDKDLLKEVTIAILDALEQSLILALKNMDSDSEPEDIKKGLDNDRC